jgi:serine protease Do
MRSLRLLLVLVAALGIIVGGGVAIPLLWNMTSAGAGATAASASEAVKSVEAPAEVTAIADRLSEAFRDVAKRVGPAVVAVTTSQTVSAPASPFGGLPDDFFRRFFGPQTPEGPQKFQRRGLGSGIIVDPEGYILTNNHVVEGAQDVTVHLADGREFKAKVVGTDPPTDVGVIKITATNLPVAQLGDSDKVQVGDLVIAIGAPFGLEQTVTAGIISATGRSGVGITDYEQFLQTDAAINPGNSGGPLVNMHGHVIGMNTAIASQSGGYMGVGFAVPASLARDIMKQLRATGQVIRGWLGVGIQRLTPEMAESMKLKTDQGVLVSQIFEGGPADKAGLKTGDVIVEYEGKPVKAPYDVQKAVAATAPGTNVSLAVLRDGKRVELKATVEKRAAQPGAVSRAPGAPSRFKDLGIEASGVTPEAAQRYGYKPGQGVLITDVENGSIADMAGLRPGMLILKVGGQQVTTVAELDDAIAKADLAKGVPMLIRSGDNQIFVLLKKR